MKKLEPIRLFDQLDQVETTFEFSGEPTPDEIADFVNWVCYVPEALDPILEAKREKAHSRKDINLAYKACLALLIYVAYFRGKINPLQYCYLYHASMAYNIAPLDLEKMETYARNLMTKRRNTLLSYFALIKEYRTTLTKENAHFYDDFLKGCWALIYCNPPFDEEGYSIMTPFYDKDVDDFPSDFRDIERHDEK